MGGRRPAGPARSTAGRAPAHGVRWPLWGRGEGIVFCTTCGQENTDGAAFCDNCGRPLRSGCPSCGVENRPEARFCRACGTSLANDADATAARRTAVPVGHAGSGKGSGSTARGPVAERRLVSVLFADLVAFTRFSEGRDPELVRDTLWRYFDATRGVIERHGGQVEKFIGDAVMAAWGAQRANEDDPERAVRAGLEVTEAVRALGEGLQARVAVLTGQAAVTVGAVGQGMVAGDLVNTAARLQAVAPPDGVLVGEATMQAAASAIAFEPAGAHDLKGKAAPVPAWRALRVISDRGGRSRSEGLEAPFVGREVELRLLKDLVVATGDERRPHLVSITGPAGIGKSRLAWELEKYVDGLVQDVYWHRGRVPSYGDGVSFWALGEMVRRRAGLVEGDDEATTRERIRRTVEEFVPDPDDRAWVEPALLALLAVEPPPTGGRELLFAAWRIFFERVAAHGTTVLVFEDLQWADGGQLDFIEHVLEWSRNVPLLVVTLARPELLERRPGWGTSARAFNAVGLEPLADHHMRELLQGLVPDLPEAALRSILERADGIPLYAVETVRVLIADGRLRAMGDGRYDPTRDLGELAIPDTLRALVASRLDALEPRERSLLQDAAVLGKTFPRDALAAISGVDGGSLDGLLRSLVKREILDVSLDPRSPERGQYGFVQSVIREVAYETLSRRERRSRHLAAARYFESHADEELAGVLANHFLAAYQASDRGPEADALQLQARLALRGAAERALTLGAADQAITCLLQALGITESSHERGDILERAALAADIEARYVEAEEFARQAIAAHESEADRSGVARVSALLGGILADASKIVETVEFLEAAIANADAPEDIETRADMLARLSRAHMRLGQYEASIRTADEALDIAEPRRLDRIVAEALVNKGSSLGFLRRIREPVLLLRGGMELATQTGDLSLVLRARNNLASILMGEDLPAAQREIVDAYELATRMGVAQMGQWLVGTIAYAAHFAGVDWDGPLALLDAELERSRSAAASGRLLQVRAFLMAWRGEDLTAVMIERHRNLADVSDPDVEAWSYLLPGIADLVAGRYEESLTAFRSAVPLAVQNRGDAHLGLIRAALLGRDLEAAREGRRLADTENWMGRFVDGERALAEAGVAALEGRRGEALAAFRRSVDLTVGAGGLFDAALVQLCALALLPDEPGITGWIDEARERFATVRSMPLLERLEEVVAARVV
jgi:class 3 adenylate cyclase/tetratricopeptide (TPR) repeat protein